MISEKDKTKNNLISKANKNAGFWVRFLAKTIDFVFIVIFSSLLLFFLLVNKTDKYEFKNPYYFYIYSFFVIFLILFFFIIIPFLFHGRSIGYIFLKLRVVFIDESSFKKSILIRELFFSISWIIVVLLVTIIINHTLITTITKIKFNDKIESLSSWDKARISIVGTLSSILTTVQIILSITIITNSKKQGIHDRAAAAFVVYAKKFIKIVKNEVINIDDLKSNLQKSLKFREIHFEGSLKEDDIRW